MPDTSVYHPDEFTLKEKLQYTLLGMIVIGGSFYVGRRLFRNAASIAEQKKTFMEGNPATYAQQLRMAFENKWQWGVDVEAVRQIMLAIPSVAAFKRVMNSYQLLYAPRSLMLDMKNYLRKTEYNEMLAILAAKPARGDTSLPIQLTGQQYQSWAQRLKAAFDINYGPIPGTDERAIKEVFLEIPTQTAFEQLKMVYHHLYPGNDLDQDLKSELWSWDYSTYMKIISDKPKT